MKHGPHPIQRDAHGLAHTQYCTETRDGGLTLIVDGLRYDLSPERIADGPALGQTLLDLSEKNWFTESVQCDLTNVVTARWMATARGWTVAVERMHG